MRAATRQFEAIEDPIVAECMAIRWALELSEGWGFNRITMETDCSRAMTEYYNPNPRSPLFGLLDDARSCLKQMEEFSLIFSPRSSNSVAHRLAKSFCFQGPTLWNESFTLPFPVLELIQKDVHKLAFSK